MPPSQPQQPPSHPEHTQGRRPAALRPPVHCPQPRLRPSAPAAPRWNCAGATSSKDARHPPTPSPPSRPKESTTESSRATSAKPTSSPTADPRPPPQRPTSIACAASNPRVPAALREVGPAATAVEASGSGGTALFRGSPALLGDWWSRGARGMIGPLP
nr:predicted GPI-anchored protein 58 [Lolium perenne]